MKFSDNEQCVQLCLRLGMSCARDNMSFARVIIVVLFYTLTEFVVY